MLNAEHKPIATLRRLIVDKTSDRKKNGQDYDDISYILIFFIKRGSDL